MHLAVIILKFINTFPIFLSVVLDRVKYYTYLNIFIDIFLAD